MLSSTCFSSSFEIGPIIDREMEMLDLEELEAKMTDIMGSKFNMMEEIKDLALSKKSYHLWDILKIGIQALLNEVKTNIGLVGKLVLLSIFAAILKNLVDAFSNKGVGEVAFYIIYIVLIGVAFASVRTVTGLAQGLLEDSNDLFKLSIPVITSLIFLSGHVTTASMFEPISFSVLYVISIFISKVLIPVIIVLANLVIVNYISSKETLNELISTIKKGIQFCLKVIMSVSFGLAGVTRLTSSVLDGTIKKATEGVISSVVPVIGDAIGSATNVLIGCSVLLKNTLGIVIIITILTMALLPIIKIVSLSLIYKVAAIVSEPIADPRIKKCLSEIAEICNFILVSVFMIEAIFMITITMILG